MPLAFMQLIGQMLAKYIYIYICIYIKIQENTYLDLKTQQMANEKRKEEKLAFLYCVSSQTVKESSI